MKELIGQFDVTDGNRLSFRVVVSQEVDVDDNNVVVSARKVFSLNDAYGEEIIITEHPDVFLRKDGSALRKSGMIQASNSVKVHHQGKSRYHR